MDEKIVTIKITLSAVGVILKGLDELPGKESRGLANSLTNEVNAQLEAQEKALAIGSAAIQPDDGTETPNGGAADETETKDGGS